MKRILLLMFALSAVGVSVAQTGTLPTIQRFEGEAGIGMIVNAERDLHKSPGYSLFAEGRFNARRTGWDLGVQLLTGHYVDEWAVEDAPTPTWIQHVKPLILTVYGDYNFRRSSDVSIFVGGGPAISWVWGRGNIDNEADYFATLSARAGVELFHRYRVTFDFRMLGSEHKIFGFNLGYTFGGRPR